jgi:hypothetical protein
MRSQLRADSHTALLAHIHAGEARGVDERRTCAAREVWFDIGDIERVNIPHSRRYKHRLFCLRNVDSLAVNNVSIDSTLPGRWTRWFCSVC